MTQHIDEEGNTSFTSVEQDLADLDAFVRSLYETVTTINTRVHQLAHKMIELEAQNERSNPLGIRNRLP